MFAVIARLRDIRFVRYLLASIGALAVDMGAFMALLALGLAAIPAAAAGYCAGIAAHWIMSSRKVFTDSVAVAGMARARQKALFVLSALAGLAITTAVVGAGAAAGIDPRLAKLVAIGLAFFATWLLRAQIVFAAPRAG